VADSALPGSTVRLQQRSEVDEFALGSQATQALLCINDCKAGGVIAAVLKLSQTLQEHWSSRS